MKSLPFTALLAVPLLAACTPHAEAPAPNAFIPTASIQEIMNSQVDPAADFLWESVSSETTAAGTVDHQPQTDAEWLELRHAAIRLVESANLLVVEGRRVAAEGHHLEDAHVPGISSATEIQQAIDADRSAFISYAHALHSTATQLLNAVDAKDPQALIVAGGHLDEACESCHMKYWYPNAPLPPELAANR
ncbi:MAG TPA: cytochrome c [Povalibacter sp.]